MFPKIDLSNLLTNLKIGPWVAVTIGYIYDKLCKWAKGTFTHVRSSCGDRRILIFPLCYRGLVHTYTVGWQSTLSGSAMSVTAEVGLRHTVIKCALACNLHFISSWSSDNIWRLDLGQH